MLLSVLEVPASTNAPSADGTIFDRSSQPGHVSRCTRGRSARPRCGPDRSSVGVASGPSTDPSLAVRASRTPQSTVLVRSRLAIIELDDVKDKWERLGSADPFWAVLAREGTEHGGWDIDSFYAEGERDVRMFLAEAEALRVTPSLGDALDFGCGVGRLSRALADRFDRVTGVDISAPMIDQANRFVAAERANCNFVLSVDPALPFATASFDFVLSNIVLQHMPPALAMGYVREFVRVLRAGGVAIFQQPGKCIWRSDKAVVGEVINRLSPSLRERIYRRRRARNPRNFPMHTIPRNKMLTFIERNGGQVVACVEDGCAGPNWRSFHYIVLARS